MKKARVWYEWFDIVHRVLNSSFNEMIEEILDCYKFGQNDGRCRTR